jgi:hypothetical protein
MAAFCKTVGGLNPWSMPSDGVNGTFINLDRRTKKWERRQYSKARRREVDRMIAEDFGEGFNHPDT